MTRGGGVKLHVGFPSQTHMHVREGRRGEKRKERKRGEREKKITSEEERGE